MKLILSFFIAINSVTFPPTNTAKNPPNYEPVLHTVKALNSCRLKGNRGRSTGNWPWIARFEIGTRMCAGTIVADRAVLTG